MKKQLLFVACLLLTLYVGAQSIQINFVEGDVVTDVTNDTARVTVDVEEYSSVAHFELSNSGANDLGLGIKLNYIDVLENTAITFCNSKNCFPGSDGYMVAESNVDTITAGGMNDKFHSDYLHYEIVGTSIVKYTFYNFYDTTDFSFVVIAYTVEEDTTTNIVKTHESLLSNPYPNPASGFINFDYSGLDQNHKINVYNAIGERVATYTTINTNGTLRVNTTDLNPGLYIYDISNNKAILRNGKFIVQ